MIVNILLVLLHQTIIHNKLTCIHIDWWHIYRKKKKKKINKIFSTNKKLHSLFILSSISQHFHQLFFKNAKTSSMLQSKLLNLSGLFDLANWNSISTAMYSKLIKIYLWLLLICVVVCLGVNKSLPVKYQWFIAYYQIEVNHLIEKYSKYRNINQGILLN